MAFVPVLNTLEVAVKQTLWGENVVNIYHVEGSGAWEESRVSDVAQAFVDWWQNDTRNERGPQACLEEVCARDLTTQTGIQVCVPHGVLNCGAQASQSLPNNVTVAIKEGTGLAGRAFRGRSYWVGLTEGQTDGPTLIGNTVADIIGDMNELSARINALGHQLVVVSKMQGSTCDTVACRKVTTPRAAGITTPITGYAIEGTTDSQRRRLPGRGN